MRSVFSPFAITARLEPSARSRPIRSIAYGDMLGGRPSRTPCERARASAARVRCEIERRSHWAKVASNGRQRLPGGRPRLQGAVEGDERPALLLRAPQQGHELEQRRREPLPLVGDERLRIAYPQRLLHPGTLRVRGREAGLLERLDELPALARAGCRERPPLRLELGAALAHHLPNASSMSARPSSVTRPVPPYSKESML